MKYFLDKGKSYSISEVIMLLGLTLNQIDDGVSELLDMKYIEYSDALISVTKKGRRFIISESVENIKYTNDLSIIEKENKIEPMGLDEIYIPKHFLERIK